MDPRFNKNDQQVLAQSMMFSEKKGVLHIQNNGMIAFIIMQT
jgi:hypothetical protein